MTCNIWYNINTMCIVAGAQQIQVLLFGNFWDFFPKIFLTHSWLNQLMWNLQIWTHYFPTVLEARSQRSSRLVPSEKLWGKDQLQELLLSLWMAVLQVLTVLCADTRPRDSWRHMTEPSGRGTGQPLANSSPAGRNRGLGGPPEAPPCPPDPRNDCSWS